MSKRYKINRRQTKTPSQVSRRKFLGIAGVLGSGVAVYGITQFFQPSGGEEEGTISISEPLDYEVSDEAVDELLFEPHGDFEETYRGIVNAAMVEVDRDFGVTLEFGDGGDEAIQKVEELYGNENAGAVTISDLYVDNGMIKFPPPVIALPTLSEEEKQAFIAPENFENRVFLYESVLHEGIHFYLRTQEFEQTEGTIMEGYNFPNGSQGVKIESINPIYQFETNGVQMNVLGRIGFKFVASANDGSMYSDAGFEELLAAYYANMKLEKLGITRPEYPFLEQGMSTSGIQISDEAGLIDLIKTAHSDEFTQYLADSYGGYNQLLTTSRLLTELYITLNR